MIGIPVWATSSISMLMTNHCFGLVFPRRSLTVAPRPSLSHVVGGWCSGLSTRLYLICAFCWIFAYIPHGDLFSDASQTLSTTRFETTQTEALPRVRAPLLPKQIFFPDSVAEDPRSVFFRVVDRLGTHVLHFRSKVEDFQGLKVISRRARRAPRPGWSPNGIQMGSQMEFKWILKWNPK